MSSSGRRLAVGLGGLIYGLAGLVLLVYGVIHGWTPELIGLVLVFIFSLLTYAATREAIRRAGPTVRVARTGEQTQGLVIDMEMVKGGRYPFPVVQFTGPDGHLVQYLDKGGYKGFQQEGDSVVVYFDPKNPKDSATILDPQAARRQLRSIVLFGIVFAAISVVGVLLIIGVLHPSWLGSVRR